MNECVIIREGSYQCMTTLLRFDVYEADFLKGTSMDSMMVNSTTTDLGLESLAMHILWYRLMYGKGFEIFIVFKITDGTW